MFIAKFPVIVVVYFVTSLVNEDEYNIMLLLQYIVSFTRDRLGRCFRLVCIYACIAVFCVLLPFLGE